VTPNDPRSDDAPPVDRVGVVGAGVMGRDLAALFANAGFDVTLVDVDPDVLDAARSYLTSEAPAALADAGLRDDSSTGAIAGTDLSAGVTFATGLAALADCAFVVEAISESLDAKRGLLADLEAVLDAEAVVGTNTSSLTVADVASESVHPERVVLFHFANPAIPRDLVEISGDAAADWALERAATVARAIGKTPIRLHRERRANGLSRLSAAIKCAGTWELLDADPPAIARGARAMGFPRGPLELIDVIGIDIHLATVDNLHEEYDGRFDPHPEIRQRMERLVEAGHTGKKAGRGFFEWREGEAVVPDGETHDIQPVVAALVGEAHRMADDGVADRETIDEILKRGGGGDLGPFDIEAMVGADALRAVLERRHAETGASVFEPPDSLGK
jgi:3-hydroxyacyl-CoA dehydrogenase